MIYSPYPFKRCTKCGNEYLASTAFYYRYFRRGIFHLAGQCRYCAEIAKGRDPKPRPPQGMKRCAACGEIKPATPKYFNRSNRNKSGLYGRCKVCRRLEAERDKLKNQKRLHSWYLQNMDAHKRYSRNFYLNNKERHKNNSDVWRSHNKAKIRAISERRRARVQGLPDTFTGQDWDRALTYFKGCCAVCGRPAGLWHILAADHWIPLASPNCPGSIPGNIVPLCHGADGCNNSKRDRDPEEWLLEKLGARKAKNKLHEISAYFNWTSQFRGANERNR